MSSSILLHVRIGSERRPGRLGPLFVVKVLQAGGGLVLVTEGGLYRIHIMKTEYFSLLA